MRGFDAVCGSAPVFSPKFPGAEVLLLIMLTKDSECQLLPLFLLPRLLQSCSVGFSWL